VGIRGFSGDFGPGRPSYSSTCSSVSSTFASTIFPIARAAGAGQAIHDPRDEFGDEGAEREDHRPDLAAEKSHPDFEIGEQARGGDRKPADGSGTAEEGRRLQLLEFADLCFALGKIRSKKRICAWTLTAPREKIRFFALRQFNLKFWTILLLFSLLFCVYSRGYRGAGTSRTGFL